MASEMATESPEREAIPDATDKAHDAPTLSSPAPAKWPRRRVPRAELELRRSLVTLRKQQRILEQRLHGLQQREKRLSRITGIKRPREESENFDGVKQEDRPSAPKRLRSELVLPDGSTPTALTDVPVKREPPRLDIAIEERKPTVSSSSEDKQRNRRLFGNLLMGTLRTAKKETASEAANETIQKRKEIEKEIEEKVSSESKALAEAQLEKDLARLDETEMRLKELTEAVNAKQSEYFAMRNERHEWLLTGFLKTESGPPIYWLPAKRDEWTEKYLGLKEREVRVEEGVEVDEEKEAEKEAEGENATKDGADEDINDVEHEDIDAIDARAADKESKTAKEDE